MIATAVQTNKDYKQGSLNDQLEDTIEMGITGLVLSIGATFLLVGVPLWIRYSRKKLLLQLEAYFAGEHIPRGIAKNSMFKGYVQYGDWNYMIHKK